MRPLHLLLCLLPLGLGCADDAAPAGHPAQDGGRPLDPPDASPASTPASSPAAAPDATAPAIPEAARDLFAPGRLIDVEIELAEADYDTLRHEGRALSEVLGGCAGQDFEYTWMPASVRIDGEPAADVGVRKKGFLGSLSAQRPSLKINFAWADPAQRFGEHKRMTLNNNRQDPSNTHQCIAYRLFRDAGVPAPRCNFARVTVNGRDLGIYSHVEAIKRPFLRQHFDDDSGRLFEGQGADFGPGFLDRFEFKNDGEPDVRDTLQAVADALQAHGSDGAALHAALEPLLPLDAFYRFWAMEALTSHWDGYSGDLNNFYVYEAPDSGLHFIPWGTDGTFQADHPFLPSSIPRSVYAWARLPNRLYASEEGRARYRSTLRELIDAHWDEETILAEVDAIGALAGALASDAALQAMRDFVQRQGAELLAELDGPAPDWPVEPRAAPGCNDRSTPVRATFATTWGSLDDATFDAANALEVTLAGGAPAFDVVLARAGMTDDQPPEPAVRLVGVRPGGALVIAEVGFGPAPFAAGTTAMHGTETSGFLATGQADNFQLSGLIGDGSITLDRAGMAPGDPVSGRFEGRVVPLGGSPFQQ